MLDLDLKERKLNFVFDCSFEYLTVEVPDLWRVSRNDVSAF